jgi:hypothetical protein
METITIPKDEYVKMQKEIELLKDNRLLQKVNELIDILFQEKYNLILTDYTEDLTEYSVNNSNDWTKEDSGWDNV